MLMLLMFSNVTETVVHSQSNISFKLLEENLHTSGSLSNFRLFYFLCLIKLWKLSQEAMGNTIYDDHICKHISLSLLSLSFLRKHRLCEIVTVFIVFAEICCAQRLTMPV